MNADVADQVRALREMTIHELQQRWQELCGEETRSGNRPYLLRPLAWRIQANAEGDLTERARRGAEELANHADLRLRAPRQQQVATGPGRDGADQFASGRRKAV